LIVLFKLNNNTFKYINLATMNNAYWGQSWHPAYFRCGCLFPYNCADPDRYPGMDGKAAENLIANIKYSGKSLVLPSFTTYNAY